MLTAKTLAGGALFMLIAASTASAEVQLSIHDGRVTLVATNATVRQILTEWARVGQTKIVNVERIGGGPLTLQFTDVPEEEALDTLLRSVTGYMAAPRPVAAAGLSRYDRILVLPAAAAPRAPVAAGPAPVQRPPFAPTTDDSDDEPSIVQPPRGPLFPTFQVPPPVNTQQQGGVASATPGTVPPQPAPFVIEQQGGTGEVPANGQPFIVYPGASSAGTPRPGMVVQPPVQPGVFPPGPPRQPPPTPEN